MNQKFIHQSISYRTYK